LLEVSRPELDDDVQHEDRVGQVVGRQPHGLGELLKLREALSDDQRPHVVQHAQRQDHEPVEVEVLVRVDDVAGQAAVVASSAARAAVAPAAGAAAAAPARAAAALPVVAGVQRLLGAQHGHFLDESTGTTVIKCHFSVLSHI